MVLQKPLKNGWIVSNKELELKTSILGKAWSSRGYWCRRMNLKEEVYLAGKSEEELATAFVDALADFIKEIDLPTTFAEMGIGEDTDFQAIADSTILTGGCARTFTKEELLEVLLECR